MPPGFSTASELSFATREASRVIRKGSRVANGADFPTSSTSVYGSGPLRVTREASGGVLKVQETANQGRFAVSPFSGAAPDALFTAFEPSFATHEGRFPTPEPSFATPERSFAAPEPFRMPRDGRFAVPERSFAVPEAPFAVPERSEAAK